MKINDLYEVFKAYPQISTDSRRIKADSIFFALKGDNFNGNQFAQAALDNGAKVAIIDENEFYLDDRTIIVDDVLETLQNLAAFHRSKLNIPILAITGTNGKTTTKELINCVLSRKFKTVATFGNLNNHIGVPLTLLSMNCETEFGIVEMGANHLGEIEALCKIAKPDYGLITNVGIAHIEGFGSFEDIVKTKTELYRFLEKNSGKAFLNITNVHLINNIPEITKITYGADTSAYCYGNLLEANPFVRLLWRKCCTTNQLVDTQLAGSYNFENILAAICIGTFFGVDANEINQAISAYQPTNNRSQLTKTEKNILLLDLYNANPSSMKAALENFRCIEANHKIVILGDMLELGEISETEHAIIAQLAKSLKVEKIFCVGPIFHRINDDENVQCFMNVEELSEWIANNNITDSTILIKGSRGIKLEKCLHLL